MFVRILNESHGPWGGRKLCQMVRLQHFHPQLTTKYVIHLRYPHVLTAQVTTSKRLLGLMHYSSSPLAASAIEGAFARPFCPRFCSCSPHLARRLVKGFPLVSSPFPKATPRHQVDSIMLCVCPTPGLTYFAGCECKFFASRGKGSSRIGWDFVADASTLRQRSSSCNPWAF